MNRSLLAFSTFSLALGPLYADQVANSCNSLGLELYKKVDQSGENLCISPYSIQSALSMTANGAKGETLAEMRKVLAHNSSSLAMNTAFRNYQKDLEKRLKQKLPKHMKSKRTSLVVANRVFVEENYKLEAEFRRNVSRYYDASAKVLDFSDEPNKSREKINKWVEKQTKDKIKDLLPEGSVTPLTRLVLTNCLHFKASWKSPFKKSATKPRDFTDSKKRTGKVPTMSLTSNIGYGKGANFEVISLPYGHHAEFQFTIVLPNKGVSLNRVTSKLGTSNLLKFRDLKKSRVNLFLPKFKVAGGSLSLNDPLKQMGMKAAFTGKADFRGISSKGGLNISSVIHKTFIELDEDGTEAAAATAVVIQRKSMPHAKPKARLVEVNRPFFYAIQDCKTGNCLFIGNIKSL